MAEASAKKKIWGWMFFDWAAQPYNTLLLTFIFGPYFVSAVIGDPVQGQIMWGYMLSIVGLSIAVSAPILGAIADSSGPRKPWIVFFSLLYVVGSFGLWWAAPGMSSVTWILIAFGIGMIGMEFATIFTNAILPDLGPKSELGRISGSGFAMGYWGGVLGLIIILTLFAEGSNGLTLLGREPLFGLDATAREGTRAVGPFTAIWYVIFMVPFFMWVPDVVKQKLETGVVSKALSELAITLKRLPSQTSLSAYLGSSMLYRDALNGLYGFGGIYAIGVLGWDITQIGTFGIIAAISGAFFSWVGGFADRKFGPKPIIIICIIVLIGVCSVVVSTSREMVLGMEVAAESSLPDTVFMICGVLIGAAGGILQAASRTMMVHQANPDRMTEAFGLYALSGKATAFLAPFAIATMTAITGSQRLGVTPLIGLFIIALFVLIWVKSEPTGAAATEA